MAGYEHLEGLLAGGGSDWPPQQMQQTIQHVEPPPEKDYVLEWTAGVVVPLVIAISGWYFMSRRNKDQGS